MLYFFVYLWGWLWIVYCLCVFCSFSFWDQFFLQVLFKLLVIVVLRICFCIFFILYCLFGIIQLWILGFLKFFCFQFVGYRKVFLIKGYFQLFQFFEVYFQYLVESQVVFLWLMGRGVMDFDWYIVLLVQLSWYNFRQDNYSSKIWILQFEFY